MEISEYGNAYSYYSTYNTYNEVDENTDKIEGDNKTFIKKIFNKIVEISDTFLKWLDN